MASGKQSRRDFLATAGVLSGASFIHRRRGFASVLQDGQQPEVKADYSLTIATRPVELAPPRIVSITTYNGQFPGPLLRFQEGKQVAVDIHNKTDTPEQLHWHGQFVAFDVDGAAEEGTPYIPPHGDRRIAFTPGPSGLRFYHTPVRAGSDLSAGQYSGLV